MRIAIDAADLDHHRIDGTRIYIQNLLKQFGHLDKNDRFLIYHKNNFDPQLEFPVFDNYDIIRKPFPFWWTQTRFAWEVFREQPDVLFMPMHSLPFLRPKKTKTVVTIHDLAFKYFPDHFPKKDLRRLNYFTDYAVKYADKIIAISKSTKRDILKIYPKIDEEKIRVIYHGYDKGLFNENIPKDEMEKIRAKYRIPCFGYILFVGTIQPRKNIEMLLKAFELLRQDDKYRDLSLVIAGSPGWLAEGIVRNIKKTPGAIMTGKFETEDLPALLGGAEIFVLPSLYEGFGLPILEAMACGTPVLAADNSSLREIVASEGCLFNPHSSEKLAEMLQGFLENDKLKSDFKKIGFSRAKDFSWDNCAKETLDWIRE